MTSLIPPLCPLHASLAAAAMQVRPVPSPVAGRPAQEGVPALVQRLSALPHSPDVVDAATVPSSGRLARPHLGKGG